MLFCKYQGDNAKYKNGDITDNKQSRYAEYSQIDVSRNIDCFLI